MAAKGKVTGKAANARVSAKIEKLHQMHPEMPHQQHIAMALGMERAGKLGPRGGYKGSKKGK